MPLHRASEPPATIFLSRRDHTSSDTAHALLLRSPSLPPSPTHSVLYERVSTRRWKQRRNLLAAIFTVTFVIFVILSLVIGGLMSKRNKDSGEKTAAADQRRVNVSVATACGTIYGRPIDSCYVFKVLTASCRFFYSAGCTHKFITPCFVSSFCYVSLLSGRALCVTSSRSLTLGPSTANAQQRMLGPHHRYTECRRLLRAMLPVRRFSGKVDWLRGLLVPQCVVVSS